MNINEAWEFCQSLARKEGSNGRFSPAEFNAWAAFAQNVAVTEQLKRIHADPNARELLEPLLKPETIPVKDGSIPLPPDCLEVESMYTTEAYEVDILPPTQYEKRRASTLLGPETKFPIARQMGQSYQVLPAGVAEVRLYYYRKPKSPVWAFEATGGSFVYKSAGSQDFESHTKLHEEICVRLLLYAGINLSNELLVQYGLQHLNPAK